MAVSIMANAGLVRVLYGKSAASDENELLRKEVASLRVEKVRISQISEGKITLAPNQRVITVETLQNFATSAQETVDTARAFFPRARTRGASREIRRKKEGVHGMIRSGTAYGRTGGRSSGTRRG